MLNLKESGLWECVVTATFPGPDGTVRAIDIRYQGRMYNRLTTHYEASPKTLKKM